MPGLPLAIREATNRGCSCSQSRTAGQMCRQQSRVCLNAEERLAAEESLSIYCKPVELYNILQRRAIQNPSFLQRCLRYKTQEKRKRRIQLTVSLNRDLNVEVEHQNFFPLYVLLASPIADVGLQHSAVYRVSRPCILANFSEFAKEGQTEATFIIPEIKKLVNDARVSDLTIIIISKGEPSDDSHRQNDSWEVSSLMTLEGNCLWGTTAVDSLCLSLEKCVTLSLGHRAEMISPFSMQPGILETKYLDKSGCIFFHSQNIDPTSTSQVQASISVQEVGSTDTSPYDCYSYDGIPASSLPHILRLRKGNVLFNYRYYNNTLQKTEVTEDFSCPFCLVKCSSFKGLGYHLSSSHDLFNFEFWVTEEYQAVNVSVRADIWKSEILSDGVDPRLQTFIFCSNKRRRKLTSPLQNASFVHPHVLESGSPERTQECNVNGRFSSQRTLIHAADVGLPNGCNERTELVSLSPGNTDVYAPIAQASPSSNFAQHVSGTILSSQHLLQFGKIKKISDDRADPRNRILLQKRQFFHSHRAQPMALEQVFSDQDSEDEVDDDIADFEDRRMLDDFVDVTKDEKHIMHLWNSFVRKQRVLADGHIPWACEAFCRLHGPDLVRSPSLLRNWMLLKIKLWNHNLLDSRTFNHCSVILENIQNESSGLKQG